MLIGQLDEQLKHWSIKTFPEKSLTEQIWLDKLN